MGADKAGNGADRPAGGVPEPKSANDRLRPFLDAHPNSSVEEIDTQKGKRLGVRKPWGEDAIVIYLPDDIDDISDALNNLYLPDRFTAIWHKDTKDFEVIWTAYPLSNPWDEIKTRNFQFQFESVKYTIEFGRSSDRLLLLAEHARPVAMSKTNHRNLFSFHQYVRRRQREATPDVPMPPIGEPISFWVRNLEWDEDRVLKIVRCLNFYLTYYDNVSPTIFIHASETEEFVPQTRYLVDEFPKQIDARDIEDYLLQLWSASREGDAGRRLIYCYRIIEYASHAYLDREARIQIRRLLSAPHALSDITSLADRVTAAALSSKAEEIQRVVMLLKDAVDPDLLWREINQNRSYFTKEAIFVGGFSLPPLISEDTRQSAFAVNGLTAFATSARHIRNHLSHGRDRTTQTTIAPTIANFHKLEPWVSALSVVAGEVINFKHIR